MASEWDWVTEAFPHGLRLTFVRGATPERLIEEFGADPATARWLTAEVTFETISDSWVRVGRTGEWVFSFDNYYFDIGGFSAKAQELSAGTELVHLDSLMGSGCFYYFADGISPRVTGISPGAMTVTDPAKAAAIRRDAAGLVKALHRVTRIPLLPDFVNLVTDLKIFVVIQSTCTEVAVYTPGAYLVGQVCR